MSKTEVVPAEGKMMLYSAVELTSQDGQLRRGETSLSNQSIKGEWWKFSPWCETLGGLVT